MPQYYRVNGERGGRPHAGRLHGGPRVRLPGPYPHAEYFRTTGDYLSCDMVPGRDQVETRFGAEVAGKLSYAAKLMNVSRLPVPPAPAPVRAAAEPAGPQRPARGYTNQPAAEPEEEYVAPPPVRPRMPLPGAGQKAPEPGAGARGRGPRGRVRRPPEGGGHRGSSTSPSTSCSRPWPPPCPASRRRTRLFLRWRFGPGSPRRGSPPCSGSSPATRSWVTPCCW